MAFRRPPIHSADAPLILRADESFSSAWLLVVFIAESVSAAIAASPPVVWEPRGGRVRSVLLTFASRSAAVDALVLCQGAAVSDASGYRLRLTFFPPAVVSPAPRASIFAGGAAAEDPADHDGDSVATAAVSSGSGARSSPPPTSGSAAHQPPTRNSSNPW